MKKTEGREGRRKVPLKPCCMISEILEEAGLDRERARELRRQILQGVILLCQWQLERVERSATAAAAEPAGPRSARRVDLD